jgi:hypothetical protein
MIPYGYKGLMAALQGFSLAHASLFEERRALFTRSVLPSRTGCFHQADALKNNCLGL